jgi:hypothetical protein
MYFYFRTRKIFKNLICVIYIINAKNINFYIFKHYLKWDTSKTNEEMTEEEIADFFLK